MAQHEYKVTLAEASTPEDMRFVVNAFRSGEQKEQERILNIINEIEEQSHRTRTPIYQDTFFKVVKEKILRDEG